MNNSHHQVAVKRIRLGLAMLGALLLLAAVMFALHLKTVDVHADPIEPPEGYPKFSTSIKTVTPTLANTGGATLSYTIEIRNTGAYPAADTTLTDFLPAGASYNDDLDANVPFSLTVGDGRLTWVGDVGFDFTAFVRFSVSLSPTLTGTVRNTAVISHPFIARPITVAAETVVTDGSILTIEKRSAPAKPGAEKPLVYTLVVANQGQPAVNLPITVTDRVPLDTALRSIGRDGFTSPISDVVTWTRPVTLALGEATFFTFSVTVDDVPSGTVITNADYQVASSQTGVAVGEPYTVTIVDPIFLTAKTTWPDPPGSNREMTYTLTVLNVGSLATNLVITDQVPAGVEYRRGGSEAGGVVSWSWPSLDTGDFAEFTFTVYISDVMDVPIVNQQYGVCCAEGVCLPGAVLTSVVQGPVFETFAMVTPIAKKPGGEEVTPTLGVRNVGNGNALSATVVLTFYRMSLVDGSVRVYLPDGPPAPLDRGPDCGDKCHTFPWSGDIGHGELVTFNVPGGISTKGGGEGDRYIATIIVTDSLSNTTTPTATSQAFGKITHYASVTPYKSAAPFIGRGRTLTYTIRVRNHGLSTDLSPILTDTIPISTTFIRASDGGMTREISDTVIVSWTLPLLGPGAEVFRSFAVLVDDDLISGTQIINWDYSVSGYGNIVTGAIQSGTPVTTTVIEWGLINSYKQVTPTVALPGPGIVLTYHLHIVNSSAFSLEGATSYDWLPWQYSTYRRDAVASAGEVVSDIVSIHWTGDVAAYSSEVVTFTVLVDPDFEGPITNTAVISHPSMSREVVVEAVAYITDEPVLRISKVASPDPVERGEELAYTIRVVNLGQQATGLVITDVIPASTEYVPGSATAGGRLAGDRVQWELPALEPGASRTVAFRVTVGGGLEVINEHYAARCAEGVTAVGEPVITAIRGWNVYLPMISRE